jgi:LAO/AO transport system kinase
MGDNKPNKSALSVSKGISQPPPLNPKLRKIKKQSLSTDEYVKGILKGNRTILSRAITLVESNLTEHAAQAQEIIRNCLPSSGRSIRVGITGVPGVGKSSFIEVLGTWLTGKGHKVAVLAIDPSSDRSKGSILGDKTRMESLAAEDKAFIRPSPSAGTLGGVARKTRESIFLCEAAGFDVIFVETVGVGQSETVVHSMVDFFLLLMLAGAGDELQGIKRGIMEMADLIAITKADGDNLEKSQRAAAEYRSALHLFPASDSGWTPGVEVCSAQRKFGIENIWSKILEYHEFTSMNGYFTERREQQSLFWMEETIIDSIKANFFNDGEVKAMLDKVRNDVINRQTSSFTAAQEVLDFYFRKNNLNR